MKRPAAKPAGKPAPVAGAVTPPRRKKGSQGPPGVVLVIVGAAIAAAAFWLWASVTEARGGDDAAAPPAPGSKANPKAASVQGADGADGNDLVTSSSPLIARLLKLLEEVDSLEGDEHKPARLAASKRVETELAKIEKEIDPATEAGKQQVAIVALVRQSLDADRDGKDLDKDAWTDEGLEKAGITTYAANSYWDKAYSDGKYGDTFDWFGGWGEPTQDGRSLADVVKPKLPKGSRILMLGCGNSNMSADMYREGYESIANVDISSGVIEQMRQRHTHMPRMTWHAMDATALDFGDGSFDAVVEKGMFDALVTGTGVKVKPVVAEVIRVLKTGGRVLSVTFARDRVGDFHHGEHLPSDSGRAENGTAGGPLGCEVTAELVYEKGEKKQPKYVVVCDKH